MGSSSIGQTLGLMEMDIVTKFLFLFLFILVSCGSPTSDPQSTFQSKFLSTQIIPDNLNDAYVFLDTDNDGIMDRYDDDIDGDKILNLVDKFPFDYNDSFIDQNNNLIPDFVDLAFSENFSSYADCQMDLFQKKDIFLIFDLKEINSELAKKLDNVCTLMNSKAIYDIVFPFVRFIIIKNSKDSSFGELGEFDRYFRDVTIYHSNLTPSQVNTTLVHELFHSVEHTNPLLFSNFIELNMDSLSPKSEINDEEAFAEAMMAAFFCENQFPFDEARFYDHRTFCESSDFETLQNFF